MAQMKAPKHLTKAEKEYLANLIERVSDMAVCLEADFPREGTRVEKQLFWDHWTPRRKALQDEIKALTGKYIGL